MRILLANTNTSPAVTDAIVAEARRWCAPATVIEGRNARFGGEIISTRVEAAISAHALVDLLAAHDGGFDAAIVGMSLDSGLWAAREMLDVPVVGMTEAALHVATLHGNRVGMLVFGGVTLPYRELAEAYGYRERLAAVEALGVTPQEHLAEPERVEGLIVERIARLADAGRIDTAIIVGAVAVGLPGKLADRLAVPTVEGISCAVLLAQSLVQLAATPARTGSFVRPAGRRSSGLSVELGSLLSARRSPLTPTTDQGHRLRPGEEPLKG